MAAPFMTIRDAATHLGVSPLTLRNWDRQGKLPATRHPMSNYRIYKMEHIEKLLKDIESGAIPSKAKPRKLAKRKLMVKSLSD